MDFGKYKYEEAQRAKESRRKSTNISIKEMKYRPKIGPGDFDTKTRKVAEFLSEGHKVKITIMFRGREVFHPELGAQDPRSPSPSRSTAVGKVETHARLDGRNMTMVLAPDKRAQAAQPRRTPRAPPPDAERATPCRSRLAAPEPDRSRRGTAPAAEPAAPAPSPDPAPAVSRRRRDLPNPKDDPMPKMKTCKTAAKRFRKTGTGKLRRHAVDAPAPVREEAVHPHPAPRRLRRRCTRATPRRSSGCSASAEPPRPPHPHDRKE